jgi:predicted acylesterase/phospholipase RssA
MDFLLEALEEWRKAKDAGEDVLRHDVSIKAIAGASAGGMTGAMYAASLDEPFVNIRDLDTNFSPARANALYRAWVESVDIESLLGVRDLGEGPGALPARLLHTDGLEREIHASAQERSGLPALCRS